MRTAEVGSIGDPDALDSLLAAALSRVRDSDGAELFAFGAPWGPEPDKPDKYFGFLPGRGIHNIHMNQGSPAPHDRDDGVWQDGGLILRFPDGGATAFFFAFQWYQMGMGMAYAMVLLVLVCLASTILMGWWRRAAAQTTL